MGAVSVTARKDVRDGGALREVEATVTFSSSYATGGDSIKLGALKLARIKRAFVVADKATASHGLQVVLGGTDAAPTLKLVGGVIGTPAEAAAASDQHLRSVKMVFLGY